MATVRHAHSSSLYSESPKSLAAQVDRGTSAEDPSANLMSFTEVGSKDRAQVLEDADPQHWAAWTPGQSDVGLMWLKAAWSPVWKEPHKLTDKVWTDGKGRKHETWCVTVLLEHDDHGGTLFYSACHLPSNVQNGKAFEDNKQAAAWKSACNGWSNYWNNKRKKHKPDAALIVADWNVDLHIDVWRDRVNAYFPSMHLTWKGNLPPAGKGTHGSRLIDGSLSTVKANDCWLLKDDSSSDHRPYGEVIPWT